MADMIKVQAAPGRRVRDPATKRPLPPEGVEVSPDEPYWFKRLRDGDVIPAAADAAPAPAASPPAAAPAPKSTAAAAPPAPPAAPPSPLSPPPAPAPKVAPAAPPQE